jgi:hypothetical protein
MDVFWFWKQFYIGLVFGTATAMSCIVALTIKPYPKPLEATVILATFSWVMLNVCFLITDMYATTPKIVLMAKFFGFIFTVLGIQSLIKIGITNHKVFENLKKL